MKDKEYKIMARAIPKYPDNTQELYNRLREAGLYCVEIEELKQSITGKEKEK